jgi:hypothetical protein
MDKFIIMNVHDATPRKRHFDLHAHLSLSIIPKIHHIAMSPILNLLHWNFTSQTLSRFRMGDIAMEMGFMVCLQVILINGFSHHIWD